VDVRRLLREQGLRPSKGLGQNFLTSRKVLARIICAAGLGPEDVVVEIGPGVGTLTERLADRAGHVVAVEIDGRLVDLLRGTLGDRPNVHIVHGDILALDIPSVVEDAIGIDGGSLERYSVVANLPYYITSACLRYLLARRNRPERIVVMVQKEVALRLAAGPGGTSLLSVSVQVYGEPKIICTVPPGAFYPRPQVASALVRIDVYDEPVVGDELEGRFFRVVRAGFGQRRKQLVNSLAHGLGLQRETILEAMSHAGLDPRRRAQSLTIPQWCALVRALPLDTSGESGTPRNAAESSPIGEQSCEPDFFKAKPS